MYQNLKTFSVPGDFRGKSKVVVQLWWIVEKTLFAWSPQFFYGWRRFLLRSFGAKIGKDVLIRPSAKFTYPWKITIGDYTWIGEDCILYSLGNISIGKHVAVAHGVYFNTGLHDYTKESFDIGHQEVIIEDEAWITNDVYIAPGVTVGKGCVIGARSNVFKDMPEGFICYGNPASAVKKRKIEN
ncbi:WcaF family extracellular polysaccharide biosynthesis acetyltransferase [Psychroserpens damuponensis]|uniref:WcaF family extracellular polysaccharide biosynthesis acetyltransferase n=1 Tax=Psychroserpens damuponensis TaxID=943936 RepID=UPI00058B37F5|nr:WcaF family extracellular polysaccharide biosynthesis acetyltransferase [Psychroserpens damuponensis]